MNEEREKVLRELEAGLGCQFADIALLDNALTHRSFVNENPGLSLRDNERLEFLGDAVLELAVSDMLMKKFPDHAEGELSKLRASIVNEQPLAALARRFRIGEFLLLGRGEEASDGRRKPSLLANAFESVIAAMYLDLFEPLLAEETPMALYRDYKTSVQEICQNRYRELPRYGVLSESGPDHNKRFATGLFIGELLIATGTGRSKKEAEQQAAKASLEALQQEDPAGDGERERTEVQQMDTPPPQGEPPGDPSAADGFRPPAEGGQP
jgi:ribonuclease-3